MEAAASKQSALISHLICLTAGFIIESNAVMLHMETNGSTLSVTQLEKTWMQFTEAHYRKIKGLNYSICFSYFN